MLDDLDGLRELNAMVVRWREQIVAEERAACAEFVRGWISYLEANLNEQNCRLDLRYGKTQDTLDAIANALLARDAL